MSVVFPDRDAPINPNDTPPFVGSVMSKCRASKLIPNRDGYFAKRYFGSKTAYCIFSYITSSACETAWRRRNRNTAIPWSCSCPWRCACSSG